MKIFKLIKLSFIVLICFYSCKKNKATNVEKIEFNNEIITDGLTTMKNDLPYTSDSVKQYYELDADSVGYIVKSLHRRQTSDNFNDNNMAILIKENDFGIKLDSKYKYYVLENFKLSDSNTAKLIIYNTFGENDSKILNVQLNSYINNVLIDQLLLDCRFTFETEYYRTFKIGADKNIEIMKFSVDNLEYNEEGDIVGEKKHGDSTKIKVDYIIDANGKFIKK